MATISLWGILLLKMGNLELTNAPTNPCYHHIDAAYDCSMASLVAQTVKRMPAMQETWVQSLGREDPLQESMATHSSILAWRIPWTEGPGRLQSMGSQRVRHD